MEWINRKDKYPNPCLEYILVWNEKGYPSLLESQRDHWFPSNIDFTFWSPIPQKPDETCQKSNEESKCSQEPKNVFYATLDDLKHKLNQFEKFYDGELKFLTMRITKLEDAQ